SRERRHSDATATPQRPAVEPRPTSHKTITTSGARSRNVACPHHGVPPMYVLSAAALALLLPLGPAPLEAGPRDRMLITPAALHARLGERNLVLLHIGDKAGYDAEHLPGARLLEYRAFAARSA